MRRVAPSSPAMLLARGIIGGSSMVGARIAPARSIIGGPQAQPNGGANATVLTNGSRCREDPRARAPTGDANLQQPEAASCIGAGEANHGRQESELRRPVARFMRILGTSCHGSGRARPAPLERSQLPATFLVNNPGYAGARSTGAGMVSNTASTASTVVRPRRRLSGFRITRWQNTGSAQYFTSSGIT